MYVYEVNTSSAMHLICNECHMRKRSIPQLRITFTLVFWMLRVHRGYVPQLHHLLTYVLLTVLLYTV